MDDVIKDLEKSELHSLKKIIDWALYTLVPLTILSLVFGFITESITIITITFDCGLSIISNLFAFISIRIILKDNVFMYPYGTGKLENFSSFFYGALLVPTAIFFLYCAIARLINPPENVLFAAGLIPLIPSVIRSVVLMRMVVNEMRKRRENSPMLHSYFVNFKIALVCDIGVMLAFGLAFNLIYFGFEKSAYIIDPILSILISIYMLYFGFTTIWGNFKSLIDLPLPEMDQLKIMSAITMEFDNYENLGNIYSKLSGKTRIIEIELYLREDMSLVEVMEMRQRLKMKLEEQFDDVKFNFIPLGVKLFEERKNFGLVSIRFDTRNVV